MSATIAPTTAAATPSAAPAAATDTPEDGLVTEFAGEGESQRSYDTVSMLLRLPGTESVSYRVPSREWYKLQQVNPVFGKLADAILEDSIDGMDILFESEGKLPEPPDAGYGAGPWWERRTHMIKAISNLPGVHDYQYIGSRGIAFHTVNKEARAALDRIVVDNLPDARQTKVYFVVSRTGPEPNADAVDGAAAVAAPADDQAAASR